MPRRLTRSHVGGLGVLALVGAVVVVAASVVLQPTGIGASGSGMAGIAPGSSSQAGSASFGPLGSTAPNILPTSPAVGPAAWRVSFAWHVPVLMYHLIATPAESGDARPGLVVAPDVFAAQMAAARAAGWRTITAGALGRDMATGTEPPGHTFVITIDDGHQDGWSEALPILMANGFVATYFVPTERIGHPGYLSDAELTAMAADGMEIANHTINHVPLALVPNPEAVFQLAGAQAALQQRLGSAPVSLAYPYGSHDPGVMADAARLGFLVAFTTVEGCSETIDGRLAEPRLRIRSSTTPQGLLAMLSRCSSEPAWG